MSNYENIRPYAEMVHEAATHGGPESFIDEVIRTAKEMGIQEERSTEPRKYILTVFITSAVIAGGTVAWKRFKSYRQRKKEEAETLLRLRRLQAIEAMKEE